MNNLKFPNSNGEYHFALLVDAEYLNRAGIYSSFVSDIRERFNDPELGCVVISAPAGRPLIGTMRELFDELEVDLKSIGIKHILCSSKHWWKVFSKRNIRISIGSYEESRGFTIYPTGTHLDKHSSIDLQAGYKRSLDVFCSMVRGESIHVGAKAKVYVRKYISVFSNTDFEYMNFREALKFFPKVFSIDLETFSLDFTKANIGTVSITDDETMTTTVFRVNHPDIRKTGLKATNESYLTMFTAYLRLLCRRADKIIMHNSSYDAKVLIYRLYMSQLGDYDGMLDGIRSLRGKIEDTQIMAHVLRNSTIKNSLSLENLVKDIYGDYGLGGEIKDISKVPLDKLCEYNATDTEATMFLYHEFSEQLLEEGLDSFYRDTQLPFQMVLTQAEIVGMPVDIKRTVEVGKLLKKRATNALKIIRSSTYHDEAKLVLQAHNLVKRNEKLVNKVTLDTIPIKNINMASAPQKNMLFYDVMGLPPIAKTAKGGNTTKAKVMKAYLNYDSVPEDAKEVIRAYIEYADTNKILTTFIPALLKSKPNNGGYTLHGSYNICGTISYRLSSSNPNLQNMPSKGEMGALIKSCFISLPGFVFGGADFNALEDRISALQTKDTNKLKVYTDGFDGHSLRAFSYFGEEMEGIENTVESINSIKYKYPELRDLSKVPTFTLTYQGGWRSLMQQMGWTAERAQEVEARFHNLYKESTQWVDGKLNEAIQTGYVTLAFGGRLHTPVLYKSDVRRKSAFMLREERKSAGNALGQSYGLLTSRAGLAFMEKVWANPDLCNKIFPISFIHDFLGFIWIDEPEVTEFVNRELTTEMKWQELEDIKHPTVGLSGDLELFYPTWNEPHKLENDATLADVIELHEEIHNAKAS